MKIEREKDETEVRGENKRDTAEFRKRFITVLFLIVCKMPERDFFFNVANHNKIYKK